MADKEVMHIPQWVKDGQEDPLIEYCEKHREDLALAHISDDELANLAWMVGDRSKEEDAALMIAAHRRGDVHLSHLSVLGAAKERIRWLSRRVMMLEGTYPGSTPKPSVKEAQEFPEQERRAWERMEENIPLFYKAFGLEQHQARMSEVAEIIHAIITDRIYDEDKLFSTLMPHRRDQYVRAWHQYVQLILTLARHGKFIPFVGDEISKVGKNKSAVTRSRYHASGQFVNYPAGVVKRVEPTVPPTKGVILKGSAPSCTVSGDIIWDWIVENDAYQGVSPNSLRQEAALVLPEDFVDEKMQPILRKLMLEGDLSPEGVRQSLLCGMFGGSKEVYKHRLPVLTAEELEQVRVKEEQREARRKGDPKRINFIRSAPNQPGFLGQVSSDGTIILNEGEVEKRAELIYEGWKDQKGWVPWVTRGNSLNQDKARSQAREEILEQLKTMEAVVKEKPNEPQ